MFKIWSYSIFNSAHEIFSFHYSKHGCYRVKTTTSKKKIVHLIKKKNSIMLIISALWDTEVGGL